MRSTTKKFFENGNKTMTAGASSPIWIISWLKWSIKLNAFVLFVKSIESHKFITSNYNNYSNYSNCSNGNLSKLQMKSCSKTTVESITSQRVSWTKHMPFTYQIASLFIWHHNVVGLCVFSKRRVVFRPFYWWI